MSRRDDPPAADPAPVDPAQRIAALDFIRGVAVLGILLANIVSFGQPELAGTWPQAFLTDPASTDAALWTAQFILIDGKMRALFTLLFGAGLAIFVDRAGQRPGTPLLILSRLGWLAVFGLAHFYLLWTGDILFLYAVCGFAAVLFAPMAPANLLVVGGIGLAGTSLFSALDYGYLYLSADQLGPDYVAGLLEDDRARAKVLANADYPGVVADTLARFALRPLELVQAYFLETTSFILIGMGCARAGFFSGAVSRAALLRGGAAAIALGLVLHALLAWFVHRSGFDLFALYLAGPGIGIIPHFVMAMGLAAVLTAYAQRASGWLFERLVAAGRAAFSNYIGTSLVMTGVFHGWGLGLFGKLDRAQLWLVALLGCALMLGWSKPWLMRFRYGPLEWLWRCLTYRRLFELRR